LQSARFAPLWRQRPGWIKRHENSQRESRGAAIAATMTTTLLIVGDADLRFALGEQFAGVAALAVEEAESAQDARTRIESGSPDVVLIADDIAPGAATLLKMARAAGFEGPAILLARGESATPEGFDGAMRRPLRFAGLMAMIRAKIAPPAFAAAVATLGDHLFCETTQTLMGPDGVRRLLTEKETAILARLARARGEVVARDVLLREIWGYSPAVDTHTLEAHIHRLRRKIEDAPGRPKLLLSAANGYRLKTNDANLDDAPEAG
jgi:DNA-binding response OmpR family regulator